jgi:phosphatidylserine decarboxylase
MFVDRMPVFARNERVILEGRRLSGQYFWMVFVGATNVGSITIEFEPALHTNTGSRERRVFEYDGLTVHKGDYLGGFRMGSSILLFADTDAPPPASLGVSRVAFGDPLPWPPNL